VIISSAHVGQELLPVLKVFRQRVQGHLLLQLPEPILAGAMPLPEGIRVQLQGIAIIPQAGLLPVRVVRLT
jgi:hypothetical protein